MEKLEDNHLNMNDDDTHSDQDHDNDVGDELMSMAATTVMQTEDESIDWNRHMPANTQGNTGFSSDDLPLIGFKPNDAKHGNTNKIVDVKSSKTAIDEDNYSIAVDANCSSVIVETENYSVLNGTETEIKETKGSLFGVGMGSSRDESNRTGSSKSSSTRSGNTLIRRKSDEDFGLRYSQSTLLNASKSDIAIQDWSLRHTNSGLTYTIEEPSHNAAVYQWLNTSNNNDNERWNRNSRLYYRQKFFDNDPTKEQVFT